MTVERPVGPVQTFRGFWHGSPLGPYQLLCLHSFVAHGHQVEVFSYDRDLVVPDWITRRDAREIVPTDHVLHYRSGISAGSPALHANLFRYALLHRLGGWWVDLDVVLLRPDPPPGEIFFAFDPVPERMVGNAIMRFPPAHPLLAEAIERARTAGENVAYWGQTGPALVTELVDSHGLSRFCGPSQSAYPLNGFDIVALFDPARCDEVEERCAASWFFHLINEVWREAGVPRELGPPRGSFLDRLWNKHDFGLRFQERMDLHYVSQWFANRNGRVRLESRRWVLEAQRDALLASTSWRMTEPLRKLSRAATGLFDRWRQRRLRATVAAATRKSRHGLLSRFVRAKASRSPRDWVAANLILFNDNGAWCWYQDPRALFDEVSETLLIGSVASAEGPGGEARGGNVELTSYHLPTGARGHVVLHERLEADDHDAPALLIRPDGRYLAAYAKHRKDPLSRWRVSIRPHDPSSWTEERLFDWSKHGGRWATYANLYHLSAERRVYNFVRAINDDPCILISADQGDTWSLGGKLFTLAKVGYVNGYVKYASNGADRIDILTTEHHPRDYNTSIYHGYLTGEKLHRSDGTVVGDARPEQGGVPQTELTKVFAAGSVWGGEVMTHAWTVDLRLDPSGSPVGIISCRANDAPDNSNFNDHRFFYARFVGNEWRVHQLARAGARLWNAEEDYTGLATIDPDDMNVVYISTPIDPRHGRTLARHEIFKGVTSDLGASWAWSAVTEASSVDNLRPMAVKCGVDTALLWLRGKMDTSQRYQMAVVGVIVSRRKQIEFKIDPDDERGRELNRRAGDFNPATLRMWQLLLGERAWTHVLDVGANYGEMLVNVDLPATARVVAFEPNPRILPYLKWNLAKAVQPVEVIASAVSDQIGTAALLVNRGYSGTTRLADPDEAAIGAWERLNVPTTTLTAVLGGAVAAQSMRVLVKIDVEGHEVPVLQGLMPALHDLAAFAALVEIKHLAREHLEWILAHFDVEIYDLHRGALERVAPSTADRLAHLLAGGRFYLQDAILRPKSDRPQVQSSVALSLR